MLLGTLALVVLVVILFVVRLIVRRKLNQAIADAPRKVEQRLGSDAEQLGATLAFADPIAGRSLIARAFEGTRLGQPTGENAWRVGAENIGGVDVEWTAADGRGVLRAVRTRTVANTLAGAGNWTRTLAQLEKAAADEGLVYERGAGVFVDSGERVKSEQVWVRA